MHITKRILLLLPAAGYGSMNTTIFFFNEKTISTSIHCIVYSKKFDCLYLIGLLGERMGLKKIIMLALLKILCSKMLLWENIFLTQYTRAPDVLQFTYLCLKI